MHYERVEGKPRELSLSLERDEADLVWLVCLEHNERQRAAGYISDPMVEFLTSNIPGDKDVQLAVDVNIMRSASNALLGYVFRTKNEVTGEYRPQENSQSILKVQRVVDKVMDRTVKATERFSAGFRPGTATHHQLCYLGRLLASGRSVAVAKLRPHMTSAAVMRFEDGKQANDLYKQFESAIAELEEAQPA